MGSAHRVHGWRCVTCATELDIAADRPWRCPRASSADPRHLLERVELERVEGVSTAPLVGAREISLVAHDADLAWAAYAAAHGVPGAVRRELVEDLHAALFEREGVGLDPTPLHRSEELSAELGFSRAGGVWVKDETGAVGGSHKVRHLAGILLQLRAAELAGQLTGRPPLAIASCGNAAIAAATLARAVDWPIDVFVPTWIGERVDHDLRALGARVHPSPRLVTDPPGDPAIHRFREAVDEGAIPFTVQGPENALCLDGGRTLGWEVSAQLVAAGEGPLDAVFVQVGGGAFAACLGSALADAGPPPRLLAVQAEGCAPLERAWERAGDTSDLAGRWAQLMTAWPDPASVADGILDDETYDWLGVFAGMRRSGGRPVVAAESDIIRAHTMMRAAGYDVSATGSAGLAGLLAAGRPVSPDERVLVVASGVSR